MLVGERFDVLHEIFCSVARILSVFDVHDALFRQFLDLADTEGHILVALAGLDEREVNVWPKNL